VQAVDTLLLDLHTSHKLLVRAANGVRLCVAFPSSGLASDFDVAGARFSQSGAEDVLALEHHLAQLVQFADEQVELCGYLRDEGLRGRSLSTIRTLAQRQQAECTIAVSQLNERILSINRVLELDAPHGDIEMAIRHAIRTLSVCYRSVSDDWLLLTRGLSHLEASFGRMIQFSQDPPGGLSGDIVENAEMRLTSVTDSLQTLARHWRAQLQSVSSNNAMIAPSLAQTPS